MDTYGLRVGARIVYKNSAGEVGVGTVRGILIRVQADDDDGGLLTFPVEDVEVHDPRWPYQAIDWVADALKLRPKTTEEPIEEEESRSESKTTAPSPEKDQRASSEATGCL
jgi:hypothetical protein